MEKTKQRSKRGTFVGASVAGILLVPGLLFFSYVEAPDLFQTTYSAPASETAQAGPPPIDKSTLSIHLPTPTPVKSIYMTQCVAGTPDFRAKLVKIAEDTEINTIVIDIKDYSGRTSFPSDDPMLKGSESPTCSADDMKAFVRSLHEKGIYVIGRITVFQDPYYTALHPELAIKKASATTTVWKDYKGLSFIDAGAQPFWDYIIELSKESFALGFDELNFDYIRFPSDGDMKDIYFPYSDKTVSAEPDTGKAQVIEEFFKYLTAHLRDYAVTSLDASGNIIEAKPVLSADLFGMTTTNVDDLNIGQVLERTLPYFDYVDPMTYPSHYPKWFNGWENPNQHIYGVIQFSLENAVRRTLATTTVIQTLASGPSLSTSTAIYAKPVYDINKIRPWLQDFDYGGNYGPKEVRDQIQATYDVGLNSWMLWDAANNYTVDALEEKDSASSSATTSLSTTNRTDAE